MPSGILDRCPGCRAEIGGRSVCRRCGSDFSLVREAEGKALGLYVRAVSLCAREFRLTGRESIAAALFLDRELPGAEGVARLLRESVHRGTPSEIPPSRPQEPAPAGSGTAVPRAVRHLRGRTGGPPVYRRTKSPLLRKGPGNRSFGASGTSASSLPRPV